MNVSDAYLAAINNATEQTVFSAQFSFIPPGSREGMIVSSPEFHKFGRLAQLNNRTYGMDAKWGSVEPNRWTLDGSFEMVDMETDCQTGEWSGMLSDAEGWFATPPYIDMTLDKPYDVIGVQIFFDDLGEEWATEIQISYYDNTWNLMDSRAFQNDNSNAPVDYPFNGVQHIRLSFLRWNVPRRAAKVCQIMPGQIRHFHDGNLFSFTLREKISPFGPLTIPEYTITFANENQMYNIINPHGLMSKLREFMEIPSHIGLVTAAGIEQISTGNFPLFSWPESTNDETASFICRPDLAFANDQYVYNGISTRTVAQTAADISAQANLKTPISVDPTLQGVFVNANIGENVPLANALSQLAVSAGGYIKFERDGTYALKTLAYSEPVRTIGYDGMWGKPNITQSAILHGVRVKYLVYSTESGRMDGEEVFVSAGDQAGRVEEIYSGFIASKSEAQRIGAIAIPYFNKRLQYVVLYRGDMSIEAGDVVRVETDYGFRNVFVLEHEITYNAVDFLQGKLVGVEI